MRRLERVEQVIDNADLTDGSFEKALAGGFRSFVRNPRNLRGFNEAERQLMRQIARGSDGVRALRGFAGMFAPGSVQGLATTAGVGFGGAGPAALVLPVASRGTSALANAMVRGQSNALRGMVGMDDTARAAAQAALRPFKPMTPVAGGARTLGSDRRHAVALHLCPKQKQLWHSLTWAVTVRGGTL